MAMRLRLLPLMIFTLVLMLGIKVGGFWEGLSLEGTAVSAAESKTANTDVSADDQAKKSAADLDGDAAEGAVVEVASKEPDLDPEELSQAEIDVLQQLLDRRQILEAHAEQLVGREDLLRATELRIDKKITELKAIQETIKSYLKRHDKEEKAKLKSLVKIYETMKPKNAARIFERLEMPILLDVIEGMKETKVAPVIARMDPVKAEAITTELAQRRQLPTPGG
ncbi:MAG: hypothetical protein COA65_09290 [Rhodospirillaceae bacterium]|nr:MAG: hypothetical protein COA65_09290 [Rhodospirillaceae bacterium]